MVGSERLQLVERNALTANLVKLAQDYRWVVCGIGAAENQ